MKKFIAVILILFSLGDFVNAQNIIYNENFDTGTLMPMGWVATPATNGWTVSTSNSSTGYAGASGANNLKIDNNFPTGTYSISTKSVATTGYSGISVSWGGRLTVNFPPSTISPQVYYSLNGGLSWTSVSYTEASTASTWALNGPVYFPAAVDNQASVMFQLVANITNAASGTYRIDDFTVKGSSTPVGLTVNQMQKFKVYVSEKTLFVNNLYEKEDLQVNLLGLTGNRMIQFTISDSGESQIPLSNFVPGIYFIQVNGSHRQLLTKKIILQ